MLHIHLPALKKEIKSYTPPVQSAAVYPLTQVAKYKGHIPHFQHLVDQQKNGFQKPKMTSLWLEVARREQIIRNEVALLNFGIGDRVVMIKGTEEQKKEKGVMQVIKISDTYTKYGRHQTWPNHDRPYIILVKWFDKNNKGMYMYCSADIVERFKEENEKGANEGQK